MFVRHLALHDFRSWDNLALDLTAGATVFVGHNGQGKTNLLESLGYLSTLSSHRVASDAPLIRAGSEAARISATAVNEGRELTVDVEILAGKSNRAGINRSPVRRTREILGIVRTVTFAPEDLALVRGDPGERRRFLDELLCLRIPRMAGVRADYDRVVRQRSALLKTAGGAMRREGSADGASALATLDVWDGHLARFGGELLARRIELVRELEPYVSRSYTSIAPESMAARVSYRSSVGAVGDGETDPARLEAALLEELSQVRQKEIARGVCLVGPHRDDLELRLGDHPAKGYASHGESWSYALALRLASFELLRSDGSDPVLMLDDVFAELDRRRRRHLAEVALGAEQVLVTAAVDEDVPDELEARRCAVRADDGERGRVSVLVAPETETAPGGSS